MKKQFFKWLHRLPVLLTALLILASSVSFAVPADASVLRGDSYIYGDSGPVIARFYGLDQFAGSSFLVGFGQEGNEIVGLAIIGFVGINHNNHYYFHDCEAYRFAELQANVVGDQIYYDFYDPISLGPIFETLPVEEFAEMSFLYREGYLSPDCGWQSELGILDVSSRFTGWLFGSVSNIADMFWTAEGGLFVLGYLAVASLALAVILLIFSLIAWLAEIPLMEVFYESRSYLSAALPASPNLHLWR